MSWFKFAKGGYVSGDPLTASRKRGETIVTLAEPAMWFKCDETPAVVYINGVEFRPVTLHKDAGK